MIPTGGLYEKSFAADTTLCKASRYGPKEFESLQ